MMIKMIIIIVVAVIIIIVVVVVGIIIIIMPNEDDDGKNAFDVCSLLYGFTFEHRNTEKKEKKENGSNKADLLLKRAAYTVNMKCGGNKAETQTTQTKEILLW